MTFATFLPLSAVIFGLLLSVAWTGFLGFGLFRLIALAF
jgi:hypothetical protein